MKDGKTWIKLYNEYLLNRTSIINSINSTPGASLKSKEIKEELDPFLEYEEYRKQL